MIKRILKICFGTLLLLIIASIIFFFWAASPTLEKEEYSMLVEIKNENALKKDSIFSIVTYNIGYLSGMTNNLPVKNSKDFFDKNLKKALTETKTIHPDIIAFQEIDYASSRSYNVNQQDEIAKTLNYNYRASAINWDKTYVPFPYWPPAMHFGKIVSGQSIISKYPLKNQQRIVLERVKDNPFYRDALYLDRLAQIVKVDLNGQEVVLINVHLEAFDKATRVRQFEVVLEIFNKYKATNPTILLGDFNSRARDKNAIIHKIFTMKDVGNAGFKSKNPQNTFSSKNPHERIDYIFYTKNTIKYINGKVLNQFGQISDHLPIEMQFQLK